MAAFNKYQSTITKVFTAVCNFHSDNIKIYLSNTAPNAATMVFKADQAEITEQNGYSAPVSISAADSSSGGTYTVNGTNSTITASGGAVGPFEFVILYDSTAASGPLIGWWDYGSALTLNSGDSFVVKYNGGASNGTVFTAT